MAAELGRLLERSVSLLWERGWQPADLGQMAVKRLGRLELDVTRCAVAADAGRYEQVGMAFAPDWMAQLEALEAVPRRGRPGPWPLQVDGAWPEVLTAGVRLLDLLDTLPEIPELTPPPSKWSSTGPVMTAGLPSGVLAKVRALLAKAEATSFDAEAESFTAKAQELMTRHRIDRATVDEGADRVEEVVVRRVWVEDPYADPKAMLLNGIAGANGCRAVWSKGFGFATVFGHPHDLAGVEELFTSLLVQSGAALRREGSKQDRYGRSRTRRFRRSFLVAFGARITERLRETAEDTVRTVEAETGRELVAVLDSRARAADEAVEETFPGLESVTMSATDWEGASAGARCADEADLTTGAATSPEAVGGAATR